MDLATGQTRMIEVVTVDATREAADPSRANAITRSD
jgi:hypothetical protein